MTWEAVIGIETHVELKTESKMFCGCPVDFGAEPNTNVCPVCLGLPGALPVPNERAIEWTARLGLALGCGIAPHSVFARKNYFYADLPKNYQISQFDLPLCVDGRLAVTTDAGERAVGITRVHLEEDTGKSTHLGEGGRIGSSGGALIDFNRSGIPLVEVVSEPDIRTPEEARAYAQELRSIVLALDISDARLEEGSMRFDGNISLRPAGSDEFGAKVEVKNMNSMRSLQRALAFEIERQSRILDDGGEIAQETRHWDEEAGRTEPGRSKEESSDYRYFSEPDLVPLATSDDTVADLRSALPELPGEARARLEGAGIDADAARVLVSSGFVALFDDAVASGAPATEAAKWLTGEVSAHLNRTGSDASDLRLSGADLSALVEMIDDGDLSSTAAKQVLDGVLAGEGSPRDVATARDLIQIRDEGALGVAVAEVAAAHPDEIARIAAGDDKVIGFLVGQVMRATGGKADPQRVSQLIREHASG
jgi:aspartyl-tRNA(Asn)/glutamyl-tRNA(Gln) amidotransferase subunit B